MRSLCPREERENKRGLGHKILQHLDVRWGGEVRKEDKRREGKKNEENMTSPPGKNISRRS